MRMRILIASALAALLAVASGLAAAQPIRGAPRAARIGIEQFKYLPPALAISVGTTVTWVNHDAEIHSVASSAGLFASPALETNETFSYTFSTPGRLEYFCALHPQMKGTIVAK